MGGGGVKSIRYVDKVGANMIQSICQGVKIKFISWKPKSVINILPMISGIIYY